MVYAFYRLLIHEMPYIMKTLYAILYLVTAFFAGNVVLAQPGHGIKPPPKINVPNIPRVITNANVNTRIHANSNSVFGTGNTHPNYNKKTEPNKETVKVEGETKKSKTKKQKK